MPRPIGRRRRQVIPHKPRPRLLSEVAPARRRYRLCASDKARCKSRKIIATRASLSRRSALAVRSKLDQHMSANTKQLRQAMQRRSCFGIVCSKRYTRQSCKHERWRSMIRARRLVWTTRRIKSRHGTQQTDLLIFLLAKIQFPGSAESHGSCFRHQASGRNCHHGCW